MRPTKRHYPLRQTTDDSSKFFHTQCHLTALSEAKSTLQHKALARADTKYAVWLTKSLKSHRQKPSRDISLENERLVRKIQSVATSIPALSQGPTKSLNFRETKEKCRVTNHQNF